MAIESKRVVAILLAAGHSQRFGRDKLAEPFQGMPLAYHAARALASVDFATHIAVVGPTGVDFVQFGFDIVRPPQGALMSTSIAAGVRLAADAECDACLIALADMPWVPAEHFRALMHAHQGEITATSVAPLKMVPALFGRALFPALCRLRGDNGASGLLGTADAVSMSSSSAFDIDVPSDLLI